MLSLENHQRVEEEMRSQDKKALNIFPSLAVVEAMQLQLAQPGGSFDAIQL